MAGGESCWESCGEGAGAGGEWEFKGEEDLGGRKGRFKTKDERDCRQETEPTSYPPQRLQLTRILHFEG